MRYLKAPYGFQWLCMNFERKFVAAAALRFTKAQDISSAAETLFLAHRAELCALGFALTESEVGSGDGVEDEEDCDAMRLRDKMLVSEARCFRPDCAAETVIFLPGSARDALPLKLGIPKPLLAVDVPADLNAALRAVIAAAAAAATAELDDDGGCGCDSGPTHGLM